MLDEFGIVGVSWRQGGSEALADYSLPSADQAECLRAFAAANELSEIAYLETCNRVEVIFLRSTEGAAEDIRSPIYELLTGRPARPGEAERVFKAWRGEGAVEHLFLVAAGLDSAAIGEVEIVGQVRACRDGAAEMGFGRAGLGLLFEETLRVAASVRERTRLGEGSVSLAELAVSRVLARLARSPSGDPARVALIGVSAMTVRAALSLDKAGVPFVVVNRTAANARKLADRYNMPHLSLAAFQRSPPFVEVLLSATGARAPVIADTVLARMAANHAGATPLCIDMAVPPDIDPDACAKAGVQRIGMDDIVCEAERNRDSRLAQAADARQLVDAALPAFRERLIERQYGPLFAALQDHYRAAANAGVKRLLKSLKSLDDEERDSVNKWAESLARRFAHLPTVGVRGLLLNGPDGALDAFLGGLDKNLATTLRNSTTDGTTGSDRADRKGGNDASET